MPACTNQCSTTLTTQALIACGNYKKDNAPAIGLLFCQDALIDFTTDMVAEATTLITPLLAVPNDFLVLKKGNLEAEEAIVIENSPLGVKSGHSAGIYTIAVNTGILKDDELTKMGCNILFHNMGELNQKFSQIVNK